MQKRVLIVDDQVINCRILENLLSAEYDIVTAANGLEAIRMLNSSNGDYVSAIILDIALPVMNGFEFLEQKAKNPRLENIPVIISTATGDSESEKRALRLGAWDYITKPYDPEILKFRLGNVISRSRFAAFERLKYVADYDVLTGIPNKSRFLRDMQSMLLSRPDTDFVLYRFDINRFKLINSFFGVKEGDEMLKYTARKLADYCSSYPACAFGRLQSDEFAFCIPYLGEASILDTVNSFKRGLQAYKTDFRISQSFGIYLVKDKKLPINVMLDRATIAAKQIKDNCVRNYAVFKDDMQKKIEQEQQIVTEMNRALKGREFEVYFQPKYDLISEKPMGAEALVRWNHPTKGLISPGFFIPVLEHNGLISALDQYIWEEVCINIREWLDRGIAVHPVSVNISRVDVYNPNLADEFVKLITRYNIPPQYLNIEVTESVFTDQTETLNATVTKLREYGFAVMMDDFGSGYSSFNVLKDVDVDVLKIDMRFLAGNSNIQKSRDIIESVVRMAQKLGIDTIAEGVETLEQAKFLSSIGCGYAQGFYYARPMPKGDYEILLQN